MMSPLLFNVYMNSVMKVKMGMGRREEKPSLLYADDLVLRGES